MKTKEKKKKIHDDDDARVLTCYYVIDTFQQNKGTNNKGLKIIEMIPYLLAC